MANERKDDGGQAFPACESDNFEARKGLSVRDYFAAKAMQSILLNDRLAVEASKFRSGLGAGDAVAMSAYDIADYMIAARKK